MSDTPTVNLKTLLHDSGLLDKAEEVEESMYQLQEGSAMVVVGIKGRALVVISPMFKNLPDDNQAAFCYRLLQLNSTLGGIASFAIQPDGWVVINGGRDVTGMDADEFKSLVLAVAQAADYFDNVLLEQFYSTAEPSQEMVEDELSEDEDAAIDAEADGEAEDGASSNGGADAESDD